MTPTQYFCKATNMACHNYCSIKPMPVGTKQLLGLGLKYCIKRTRPTNKLDTTIDRFTNDVRRTYFFKYTSMPEEDGIIRYIPGLYHKSDWEPPKACKEIEQSITNFSRELRNRQSFYQSKPTLSNLTSSQWGLIDYFKDNNDHIVIEADKNLGGCLLDRPVYITRGIEEHLGNTSVYRKLTKSQAIQLNFNLRYRVNIWISKWQDIITPAEHTYIHESIFKYPKKIARFRMSLKAHKTPWKMRPIVCCAGTFINCLSRWLDHWFQKLRHLIPTYIKDSSQLLGKLADLGELPPTARLFTADAVSMYTNIDPDHAIQVIGEWFDMLLEKGLLPPDFPLAAVKEAMALVMRNNIFEWGNLYFLQLLGTAMGTSSACMWATIYFGVHESGKLIPTYNRHLLLFQRFIDDIIGIWIDNGSVTAWESFKRETNDFGILKWDFEDRARTVNFLDLTISIENNRITTKTYQKALNLYQYILPTSAHPPNMMEGIIYGLLRNYRRQNTNLEDYHNMAILLFKRHVARGWDRATMKGYILNADKKLNMPTPTTNAAAAIPMAQVLSNRERLFIHMEYHPNDIPKKAVRALYEHYCKSSFERLGIQQLTIAYSRPPNIKDSITKAKLHQAPGKEASKYYLGELVNR